MTQIYRGVTLFLFLFCIPIHVMAFEQTGLVKIPATSIDKGSSGVMRVVCYKKLLFVLYNGRRGGDSLQLMHLKGKSRGSPHICESDGFLVTRQMNVAATTLSKAETGVMRVFEIEGESILLVAGRNGAASLQQIFQP